MARGNDSRYGKIIYYMGESATKLLLIKINREESSETIQSTNLKLGSE